MDGLNDYIDNIWSDVSHLKPFPIVEQVHAHNQGADVRQSVMVLKAETATSGAVMATKGMKSCQSQTLVKLGSSSTPNGQSDGSKCTHCENTQTGGRNYKPRGNRAHLHLKEARLE